MLRQATRKGKKKREISFCARVASVVGLSVKDGRRRGDSR